MNAKKNCQMCGTQFNVPDSIKAGNFYATEVCKRCYTNLANDPDACFGKQYDDGTPLARLDDPNCAACPEYKVCSVWPRNSVIWKQLRKDSKMPEKKKREKKTAPPEPRKRTGSKPAAKSGKSAGKPETQPKAQAAPAAEIQSTNGKKEKLPLVEFAKDLKFREGTSIVVVMRALTSKPEITMKECCDILQKSGVASDNVKARVMKGFSYMKERGLMGKKIDGDEVIFYKK